MSLCRDYGSLEWMDPLQLKQRARACVRQRVRVCKRVRVCQRVRVCKREREGVQLEYEKSIPAKILIGFQDLSPSRIFNPLACLLIKSISSILESFTCYELVFETSQQALNQECKEYNKPTHIHISIVATVSITGIIEIKKKSNSSIAAKLDHSTVTSSSGMVPKWQRLQLSLYDEHLEAKNYWAFRN